MTIGPCMSSERESRCCICIVCRASTIQFRDVHQSAMNEFDLTIRTVSRILSQGLPTRELANSAEVKIRTRDWYNSAMVRYKSDTSPPHQ
jgi:hypothetical protein